MPTFYQIFFQEKAFAHEVFHKKQLKITKLFQNIWVLTAALPSWSL